MNGIALALMRELRAGLVSLYGGRLRGVYLFGSYARGEEDPESDLDILVVLDEVPNYAVEVERTSYLGSDLSLKYRVSVSQVFLAEEEWLHGETPFLANVREEATAI